MVSKGQFTCNFTIDGEKHEGTAYVVEGSDLLSLSWMVKSNRYQRALELLGNSINVTDKSNRRNKKSEGFGKVDKMSKFSKNPEKDVRRNKECLREQKYLQRCQVNGIWSKNGRTKKGRGPV